MSASTYHVETVYSSMNDTEATMLLKNSGLPHFRHADSSSFWPALSPSPLASASSTRAMAIYRPPLPRATPPPAAATPRTCQPQLIATISAGFEKGDYLIREERGSNIYFDFFEEAYNFACQKGYARMPRHEEADYMEVIRRAYGSVPGGCRYNTGRLLVVLRKLLVPVKVPVEEDEEEKEPCGLVMEEEGSSTCTNDLGGRSRGKKKERLARSTNTLPTDSESSGPSTAYSSASTSYADSWE